MEKVKVEEIKKILKMDWGRRERHLPIFGGLFAPANEKAMINIIETLITKKSIKDLDDLNKALNELFGDYEHNLSWVTDQISKWDENHIQEEWISEYIDSMRKIKKELQESIIPKNYYKYLLVIKDDLLKLYDIKYDKFEDGWIDIHFNYIGTDIISWGWNVEISDICKYYNELRIHELEKVKRNISQKIAIRTNYIKINSGLNINEYNNKTTKNTQKNLEKLQRYLNEINKLLKEEK